MDSKRIKIKFSFQQFKSSTVKSVLDVWEYYTLIFLKETVITV